MADWRNRIVKHAEVSPGELTPNPLNWRAHPKQQADALAGLIETVGWVDDVIVNVTTGNILDGHLRVKLAQERNEPTVPVKYVELSEDEENLVLASFDPITGLAEMDAQALAELLGRVDMQAIEDDGLAGLLEELATASGAGGDAGEPVDAAVDVDRAEELRQKWDVSSGDLWLLDSGKGHSHRLICGDCTDADVVGRVLNGDVPLLMVTDPPYGVNYDPNWRNEAAEAGHLAYSASRVGKVQNDDRVDWSDAYRLFPGDVAYTWSPGGDHVILTGAALQGAGYEIRNQIMWRKPHFPISRGHYTYQHEPCWYAVKKGRRSHWIGDHNASTVWDISLDKNVEGGHSTQKPLECMARPIRNHEGDVYEPFCGSGTCIIAAENLGRRCFAVEIDAGYVAVALERFFQATNVAPVRIENAPAEAEAVEA